MMPVAALTVTLESMPRSVSKPVENQANAATDIEVLGGAAAESSHKSAAKAERIITDAPKPPVEESKVEPLQPQNMLVEELPPAPSYVKTSELDPPPVPLNEITPEYPDTAGIREGFVVLRILINEQGKIDNLATVRSFPKGIFDNAARTAFGKATFSPGMRFGIPVKSQLTIEVHFTPDSRGGDVSGRGY